MLKSRRRLIAIGLVIAATIQLAPARSSSAGIARGNDRLEGALFRSFLSPLSSRGQGVLDRLNGVSKAIEAGWYFFVDPRLRILD